MANNTPEYKRAFKKVVSKLVKEPKFRNAVFSGKEAAKKKLKSIIKSPQLLDQVADALYSEENKLTVYKEVTSLRLITLMAFVFGSLKDKRAPKKVTRALGLVSTEIGEPWDMV